MPTRPRAHIAEDLSRNCLHAIFEEAGWVVEDIVKDYGEDLLVRIFTRGKATPFKFFVQVKATDNISRFITGDGHIIRFPVKKKHISQWKEFNEPVILAIWDSRSKSIYWTYVQREIEKLPNLLRATSTNNASVLLSISRDNILDRASLKRIRAIARTRHSRVTHEREGAERLKSILEQKLGAKIERDSRFEVIILQKPSGSGEVFLFGRTALLVQKLSQKLKTSPRQALRRWTEKLLKDFAEYERSGLYPVFNAKTGKAEMQKFTLAEFRNYMSKQLDAMNES